MAVAAEDLAVMTGKKVRVKLVEQHVPLEGELLPPRHTAAHGYGRHSNVFGIQAGQTLRVFQPEHVEEVSLI